MKTYLQEEISLIDLSDEGRTCDNLNIGPLADIFNPQTTHGTFIGGRLLVCGDDFDSCYTYDDTTGEWARDVERNNNRFLPYGLDMDGYHWVSGGEEVGLGFLFNSSEKYDGSSSTFQESVDLPFPTRDHCAVRIGQNLALVMGGRFCLNCNNAKSETKVCFPTFPPQDITAPTWCTGSTL